MIPYEIIFTDRINCSCFVRLFQKCKADVTNDGFLDRALLIFGLEFRYPVRSGHQNFLAHPGPVRHRNTCSSRFLNVTIVLLEQPK